MIGWRRESTTVYIELKLFSKYPNDILMPKPSSKWIHVNRKLSVKFSITYPLETYSQGILWKFSAIQLPNISNETMLDFFL